MDTCFHILAVVNNAAMNMGAQTSFWGMILLPLGIYSEEELLNNMIVAFYFFFFFEKPSSYLPQWQYQFILPSTISEGSLFSTSSPILIISLSLIIEILKWDSLKGLMLKLELQYFRHMIQRANSLERPWCWERLKAGGEGTTEDEMVGWDHRLNGHEFEQTLGVGDGQGSLACCSPWGLKESNKSEWVNNRWDDTSL